MFTMNVDVLLTLLPRFCIKVTVVNFQHVSDGFLVLLLLADLASPHRHRHRQDPDRQSPDGQSPIWTSLELSGLVPAF